MRLIADHKYTKVHAHDERTEGNANHHYEISQAMEGEPKFPPCIVGFQHGPIGEKGVNGVTNEDLLAIVIDRLYGFQAGKFKCRENAIALTKLEETQMWLYRRTALREKRGVEGTNKV